MRVSEAIGLDRQDVDLSLGIIHIRRTKFGKSRYVPVHPSTVEALKRYAEARDRIIPSLPTPAFFISERGGRITEWTARYTFAKLSQHLGLRISAKGHGRGPRLHDMRHRYAAHTLVRWIAPGSMSNENSPSWLPTWGTSTSTIPTGTWKPCQNSFNWLRIG